MNGSGMGKNRNGYALSQTFFVTTFSFSRYFLTSEKNTKTLWQALRTSTKHAELFLKTNARLRENFKNCTIISAQLQD